MRKGQTIVKILPDRIFDKLWSSAEDFKDVQDYANYWINKVRFSSYNIDSSQSFTLLYNIYTARNLSMKEIFESSSCKKSQFAHIFCVNIRTLNYWIAENSCPSYIRLMFLRRFNLISLGKHIYLESDYKERKKYSVVKQDNIPIISKEQMRSLKEYEQIHVHSYSSSTQEILERTDYIRNILHEK